MYTLLSEIQVFLPVLVCNDTTFPRGIMTDQNGQKYGNFTEYHEPQKHLFTASFAVYILSYVSNLDLILWDSYIRICRQYQ